MVNYSMEDYQDYYGEYLYHCGMPYSRYYINIYGDIYDSLSNQWVEPTRGPNTPYVGVTMFLDGQKRSTTVHLHRLLAKVFLVNKTNLPFEMCQVDHINGNKLDNDLSNLEIVTPQENKARAYSTGLRKDNNYITLTNVDTNEVYQFYSQAKAAAFLGINPGSFCEYLTKHDGIIDNYRGFRVERVKQ